MHTITQLCFQKVKNEPMHGTTLLTSWRSTPKQDSSQNVKDKFSTTITQHLFKNVSNILFQWRNLWNRWTLYDSLQYNTRAYSTHIPTFWISLLPTSNSTLKTEAAGSSKTLIHIYQPIWGHNPEGCNLNVQWHNKFHHMNVEREKNLAMLHVPYKHFQWTLTSISWLFHEKSNFTMSNVPHNHFKRCLSYSPYLMCSAD
jgi:hypothetical protein